MRRRPAVFLIDVHIVLNFLVPTLLCILFVVFMIHVSEVIDRLGLFFAQKTPVRQIVLYFVYKSPFLIVEFLPVAVLFGTVFSLAEMARHHETLAVLSTGVSFRRVIRPLVLAGAALSLLGIVFSNTVVPAASAAAEDIRNNFRRSKKVQIYYDIKKFSAGHRVVFVSKFDYPARTLYDLLLIERDNADNLKARTDAARAVWNPSDRTWTLRDGRTRTFASNRVTSTVSFTQRTAGFRDTPEDFKRENKEINGMSISDAWTSIRKLKESGFSYTKELVEFHWKFSFPVGVLVMVLIGAPLSGYSRRNVLITSMFFSFIVTFVYYILLYLGITLGKNEVLPPILAAWIGNLVFGGIVWYLFRKMRT